MYNETGEYMYMPCIMLVIVSNLQNLTSHSKVGFIQINALHPIIDLIVGYHALLRHIQRRKIRHLYIHDVQYFCVSIKYDPT